MQSEVRISFDGLCCDINIRDGLILKFMKYFHDWLQTEIYPARRTMFHVEVNCM